MTAPTGLPKLLQPALKALEKDLLARAKTERVEAGLKKAWEDEQKAGQTGLGFDPWRRERVTQLAVAWILSVVFVRTLEDRGYVDPRVAGATADALRAAEDREALFLQVAPFLGPREYLLAVFRELSKLPGARDVFDTRHNPVWVLSPSSEGARALLDFFRKRDASGAPTLVFAGGDTRFLGDLYQDLSEAVRKRYALLQTPEFVEEFILDQTLDPAIAEFGLKEVTLIDPTCGSGHFLLGAFRRLLGRWQEEAPTEHIADLARRALDQVYGVDINPYAVAIARFRLVLAVLDAVGIKRLERAPDIKPNVVVADSLLHRFDQRVLSAGEMSMDDDLRWGDRLFRLENRRDVERVLTKRFHAVVGNPPYITEQDPSKRKKYRDMYESASGKYSLSAPFTERFFDLGAEGGFVGLINSNAWTKRDFGKTLIEKVLPRLDVQKIIDTSGCYLPGHGTPTLLLFGRNRKGTEAAIVAVLGKRGERDVPDDPATAPVWSEITRCHNDVGFDGDYVSTEPVSAQELRRHPWVMAGGGARTVLGKLASAGDALSSLVESIGFMAITGADDAFNRPMKGWLRAGVDAEWLRRRIAGSDIRDWLAESESAVPFPYRNARLIDRQSADAALGRPLWACRRVLLDRPDFSGGKYLDVGRTWFEFHQVPLTRLSAPFLLAYGEIATHNHFVISKHNEVFDRTAPVAILKSQAREDYRAAIGYLNSSTVGFWGRLNFFQKGGDQVGAGARLSKTPWQDRLQRAGNVLQQLPVPKLKDLRDKLLDLVVAAEETVQKLAEQTPDKLVIATLAATPTLAALRDARTKSLAERARHRGLLVSLQEEMDWRVYGILGLSTVEAPSVDAVRVVVEPNQRPFEVRLAREVRSDVSASEWFRVHKRDAPKDVAGPLADLYRQRLRLLDDPEHGAQLRLLETPETKRRWSPLDGIKAFSDAVRSWLLERIEASFREQSQPELRTARQLALELGRDPAVTAAHELLTEESGLDLVRLVSELVDAEGVPFLAGYRYAETGMEKRASWEETWRLQRLEDEGKLAPELKRFNLKAIPPPDKYAPKDFLRHYWSLRGKLDVPKERFVTVPGGNTDEDTTPLVGWAGWDHLQTAQALSGLYQRRKTEDGWQKNRLVPLLAGIAERVPWLLQWHNEPNDAFGGMKLGEFFRDFVVGEAHTLGIAVDFTKATDDLRTWTPPAAPKRTTVDPSEVLAALQSWKPEVEEDEDDDGEDAELPEGPTDVELASAVGVTKALVAKALKKLIADGLVEKLSGRPARYVATGDQA
ncbi:BREX-2 system adenine-specific DNA-methyltransferase PglX [Sorangium sp. So ce834]|uniref:BREX-2 system adenine-specific DNA-methyltransferase PglX n=1 Tax=Sorangium sp. So ce834 TaxID=3133321 RepID=UPI003F6398D5